MKFAVIVKDTRVLCVKKDGFKYTDTFGNEDGLDQTLFQEVADIKLYTGDFRDLSMMIFPSIEAAEMYLNEIDGTRLFYGELVEECTLVLLEDL